MNLRTLFLTTIILFGTSTVYAEKFNQKEFDEMVSVYLMLLENRQAQLDQAIEQDKDPEIVIGKACLYSGTWKRLLKIGLANSQLDGARKVIDESLDMSDGFDEFFETLGSSYKESCREE